MYRTMKEKERIKQEKQKQTSELALYYLYLGETNQLNNNQLERKEETRKNPMTILVDESVVRSTF